MPRPMIPLEERFWTKVKRAEGRYADRCWLWIGAIGGGGYGQIKVDGRMIPAHRVAYEMLVGPIPDGLTLDHLCRVRHCVNPAHLEPVTRWENTSRGVGWTAQQVRKTHCKNGHPFDDENTYVGARTRQCRACNLEAVRRLRERKKAADVSSS